MVLVHRKRWGYLCQFRWLSIEYGSMMKIKSPSILSRYTGSYNIATAFIFLLIIIIAIGSFSKCIRDNYVSLHILLRSNAIMMELMGDQERKIF